MEGRVFDEYFNAPLVSRLGREIGQPKRRVARHVFEPRKDEEKFQGLVPNWKSFAMAFAASLPLRMAESIVRGSGYC